MKIKFSVIVPVYNCQNSIKKLINKIIKEVSLFSYSFEIILVDDCSLDKSWNVLKSLREKNKKIKIFKNKKNVGQHPSIYKGIERSKGKNIFIMDCDLQDNPINFKKFLKSARNAEDVVVGLMNSKSQKKGYFSKLFWITLNIISKYKFPSNLTNFTLISSKQAKRLLKIRNVGFLYGDICRLNMKIKFIEVKRDKSYVDGTSYTLIKIIKLAIYWLWIYTLNTRNN